MLYFDRIEVSNKGFKFQPNVCNRCHCLLLVKELLTFDDTEIDKNKFYHYKSPVPLRDLDIEKVLVSNKISFGEKNINTLLVTSLMIIKLSH